ncbi:MAG: DUF6691 family protein [Kiloniellales bacterium]
MSLPLYDNGFWPALVLGLLFGLALEGAGFGSPRKLVAQFTLRDFTVFKVMFTAVVVAAVGRWLAEAAGAISPRSVYTPTLYFWAIALGGALMGAGFAVGGYCPGTSTVGLASGRLDAAVFGVGMVAGVAVFAGLFEPLEAFYLAAPGPKGQTLDQLFGVPTPVVLVALIAIAGLGWWLGSRLEARFGGPVTAAEVAGEPRLQDQAAAPAPSNSVLAGGDPG